VTPHRSFHNGYSFFGISDDSLLVVYHHLLILSYSTYNYDHQIVILLRLRRLPRTTRSLTSRDLESYSYSSDSLAASLKEPPAAAVLPLAADQPALLNLTMKDAPMGVEVVSSPPSAAAPASSTPSSALLREALLQAPLASNMETLAPLVEE
jgi:hypothetical protein